MYILSLILKLIKSIKIYFLIFLLSDLLNKIITSPLNDQENIFIFKFQVLI